MPMGRIGDEAGAVVPIDGPLPDGVLGEVRIHREIYRRRPEAGGICRFMSPALMALSVAGIAPVPRHVLGAYFDAITSWHDPRLLHTDKSAAHTADLRKHAPTRVLHGHGAVEVGANLPHAA